MPLLTYLLAVLDAHFDTQRAFCASGVGGSPIGSPGWASGVDRMRPAGVGDITREQAEARVADAGLVVEHERFVQVFDMVVSTATPSISS